MVWHKIEDELPEKNDKMILARDEDGGYGFFGYNSFIWFKDKYLLWTYIKRSKTWT